MINRQFFGRALRALLFSIPIAGFADTISLMPASQNVDVNQTVNVDVTATGMQIGAYDLNVNFDPALLKLTSITFDQSLGGNVNALQFSDIGFNFGEAAEVSLLSNADLAALQSGAFPLFHLHFLALAAGTDTLSIGINSVADPNALPLNPILETADVVINVPAPPPPPTTGVPEPSAAGMVAVSGAGALWCIRRRNATARQ